MTINPGENKSTIGLRSIYYALVQDGVDDYTAATPEQLAPAINASVSPSSNSKTQYAEDGPFDVMSSEGETKIELEVTAIPLSVQAVILGRYFDPSTGRIYNYGGTPPDVALSFKSIKSTGHYIYVQFLKGKFTSPNEEHATKTDSPEPKSTKITYTAVKTTYQWDLMGDQSLMDGVKSVIGDEDIDAFDGSNWFGEVQVPDEGA